MALVERYRVEQARADRRAGEIVAMLHNINRDSKKDPKGISWLEVFPEHRESKPAQTDEEMFLSMQLWATATRGLAKA